MWRDLGFLNRHMAKRVVEFTYTKKHGVALAAKLWQGCEPLHESCVPCAKEWVGNNWKDYLWLA
jgi:hypothetical protein